MLFGPFFLKLYRFPNSELRLPFVHTRLPLITRTLYFEGIDSRKALRVASLSSYPLDRGPPKLSVYSVKRSGRVSGLPVKDLEMDAHRGLPLCRLFSQITVYIVPIFVWRITFHEFPVVGNNIMLLLGSYNKRETSKRLKIYHGIFLRLSESPTPTIGVKRERLRGQHPLIRHDPHRAMYRFGHTLSRCRV